jgi:hypothetical protein
VELGGLRVADRASLTKRACAESMVWQASLYKYCSNFCTMIISIMRFKTVFLVSDCLLSALDLHFDFSNNVHKTQQLQNYKSSELMIVSGFLRH